MKYKVYATYLDNFKYYIGYSGKAGKAWEAYFGSNNYIKDYEGLKLKEIIFETNQKSHALYLEFFLQMQNIHDPRLLNEYVALTRTRNGPCSITSNVYPVNCGS